MERTDSNSIRQFFDYLNNNCDYLVLRNWDGIFDERLYGTGHEDIDILCRDLNSFILLTNAKRVHKSLDRDNFIIPIGDMMVRFDIRHIGDDYYPAKWEDVMLKTKVLNADGVYVMNPENYVYSLAYHAIMQKPHLSREYQKKISDAYGLLENTDAILHSSDILILLRNYCQKNKYEVSIPADPGVYINKKNSRGFIKKGNIKVYFRRCVFHVTKTIKYYKKRIIG